MHQTGAFSAVPRSQPAGIRQEPIHVGASGRVCCFLHFVGMLASQAYITGDLHARRSVGTLVENLLASN